MTSNVYPDQTSSFKTASQILQIIMPLQVLSVCCDNVIIYSSEDWRE